MQCPSVVLSEVEADMRDGLLELLQKKNRFVSGQEIADTLGISRSAVWKSINRIRQEGYQVEAVTGKGYRIMGMEDAYGENSIRSALKTVWLGRQTVFFDEIDSTNDEVRRRAQKGAEEGLLVAADCQTKGKGRRGRSWENPPGTQIAMSFLLKPDFSPDIAPMLTLVMAMASVEGIRKVTELSVRIKWPNDIVINGKKLVGILTEMTAEPDYIHEVIIGTGINVNIEEFPEELKETATSLYLESGKKWPRALLTGEIINSFEKYYEIFRQTGTFSELREEYNKLCINAGRRVCVLDPKGEFEAQAQGINDKGELIVTKDDGSVVNVFAGEVSVRGIYGYV